MARRVLFDHGTPVGLRSHLRAHRIETLASKGWAQKENGELLDLADDAGYEALVTTDRNIRHQQNLTRRKIAVVVLVNARWPDLRSHATAIATAIEQAKPGQVSEVQCAQRVPSPPAAIAAARGARAPARARNPSSENEPGHGHND